MVHNDLETLILKMWRFHSSLGVKQIPSFREYDLLCKDKEGVYIRKKNNNMNKVYLIFNFKHFFKTSQENNKFFLRK